MFLDYFGLKREPFTIAPDPSFLYPSSQHRQALAHLKYGLNREGGFVLLTGEVGTGKTTLTRLLIDQVPGNIRVAYVLNAQLNTVDLLASIYDELKIEEQDGAMPDMTSVKSIIAALNKDLLSSHAQGLKTLVVIEEAQNLDLDVLETLRLLTNLETNTHKLLHILLVGQPELLDTMARREMRQLNQRVVARFHLQPLSLADTTKYVNHRLKCASSPRALFDDSAMKAVYRLSGGIPRLVNLISQQALLGCYSQSQHLVSKAIVTNAAKEILPQAENSPWFDLSQESKTITFTLILVVLFCLLGVAAWLILSVKDDNLLMTDSTADQAKAQIIAQASEQGDVVDIVAAKEQASQNSGHTQTSLQQGATDGTTVSSTGSAREDAKEGITNNAFHHSDNVFHRLLSAWIDVPEDITVTHTNYCQVAKQFQLTCAKGNFSPAYIRKIGLVGILPVRRKDGLIEDLFIDSYQQNTWTLHGQLKTIQLTDAELAASKTDSFYYVWPAPPGFRQSLRIGDKNPALVSWLQQHLSSLDPVYGDVITGGVYTQLLSEGVAQLQAQYGLTTDGILGRQTIVFMLRSEDKRGQLVIGEL